MYHVASAQRVSISSAEDTIKKEVPPGRREEILEYLRLFGYKPDSTIIQVHVTGFFNRRGAAKREVEKRQAAAKRYGGTTFVVVGRTHDPSIIEQAAKPRKSLKEASPGYMGYLWRNKDPGYRPPHEVIPLDFVPVHVPYPKDWKDMFATKGILLAMHVPAAFASRKNSLTRALYRLGKNANAKEEWKFLDELKGFCYEEQK
jgi:hypothetical protein